MCTLGGGPVAPRGATLQKKVDKLVHQGRSTSTRKFNLSPPKKQNCLLVKIDMCGLKKNILFFGLFFLCKSQSLGQVQVLGISGGGGINQNLGQSVSLYKNGLYVQNIDWAQMGWTLSLTPKYNVIIFLVILKNLLIHLVSFINRVFPENGSLSYLSTVGWMNSVH